MNESLLEEYKNEILNLFVEEVRNRRCSVVVILDLTDENARTVATRLHGEDHVAKSREVARKLGKSPIELGVQSAASFAGGFFDGINGEAAILDIIMRKKIPILVHSSDGLMLREIDPPASHKT